MVSDDDQQRPEPGTATVIVRRIGPQQSDDDRRLLRATEQVLALPSGAIVDREGMSRPEFRLVEGVSRETADRVAAAAVRAGFSPRVRDELGIQWSNQRGTFGFLMVFAAAVLLPLLMLGLSTSVSLGGAVAGIPELAFGSFGAMLLWLPVYLASVFGALAWQRSRLYLPLLISPVRVFSELDPATDTVAVPVREARAAVNALRSAIGVGLPAVASADLTASVEALEGRVSTLATVGAGLEGRSTAGIEALRRRLAAVVSRDDADSGERASLEQALRDETEAEDGRERRLTEVVRDLMAIRRAATEARLSLADPDGPDPIARLSRDVEALKGGLAEADPRVAAALRARRSQRETG